MSKEAAIEAARKLAEPVSTAQAAGKAGPALSSLPAAAAEVNLKTASTWFQIQRSGPLFAPNRCVWVVTVHAPFKPDRVPPPSPGHPARKRRTYDHYAVMYDAASGQFLQLAAGTSAPNLITGEFLGQNRSS